MLFLAESIENVMCCQHTRVPTDIVVVDGVEAACDSKVKFLTFAVWRPMMTVFFRILTLFSFCKFYSLCFHFIEFEVESLRSKPPNLFLVA